MRHPHRLWSSRVASAALTCALLSAAPACDGDDGAATPADTSAADTVVGSDTSAADSTLPTDTTPPSDTTGADAGDTTAPEGAVDHLFALFACELQRTGFCGSGAHADFDRAAFRDIYVDPFGAGPAVGLYPTGDQGSYTAFRVPQCDDADEAAPVTTSSGVDPATWRCADGQSTIRCTDGTRPIAYTFPSQNRDSTKWLIAISSGGVDCSGAECVGRASSNIQRFSSVFAGADKLSKSKTNASGVFQRSEFSGYHRIMIDQCGGGRGLGKNDAAVHFVAEDGAAVDLTVHHHGSRILRATLDHLLKNVATVAPTQIVFASQSNGSNGAYSEVDQWAAWLRAHPNTPANLDVRLFANSYLRSTAALERCKDDPGCTDVLDAFDHGSDDFNTISGTIDAPGSPDLATACPATGVGRCLTADGSLRPTVAAHGIPYDTLVYQPGGNTHHEHTEWGVDLDASCVSAHPDDPGACMDQIHVALFHLGTPTYFGLSGYDRFMRSEDVYRFTPDYEAYSLQDYYQRLVPMARSLARTKPGQKDPVSLPGHGVWIDNSADHDGPTSQDKLNRELALSGPPNTIALHESLLAWLNAKTAHTPVCISDGDAHQNPTNPMNTSHGGTAISPTECF